MTTVAHWTSTRLPTVESVRERLAIVFPVGVEGRSWAVAERAAKALFVFLYVQAIQNVSDRRLRPSMITDMTDTQAGRQEIDERLDWWHMMRGRRVQPIVGTPWYAANSREGIRDETFRVWREHGALHEDQVPTTSATPRYQLLLDFADIFDPNIDEATLVARVQAWQSAHLTGAARARIAVVQQHAVTSAGAAVHFPDGSARTLALGPSTLLVRAAIEQFLPRFTSTPVVLAITESRQRLAYDDGAQLARLGIVPDPRIMPDILAVDLGKPIGELTYVLLECVATTGAMTSERRQSLLAWLHSTGLGGEQVVFGSVFPDRSSSVFRRYAGELSWGVDRVGDGAADGGVGDLAGGFGTEGAGAGSGIQTDRSEWRHVGHGW
jgi:hypothetical protein